MNKAIHAAPRPPVLDPSMAARNPTVDRVSELQYLCEE
jgi:hypothetical protein